MKRHFYLLPIEPRAMSAYCEALDFADMRSGLEGLASAIATSSPFVDSGAISIVVRGSSPPLIGIWGAFDAEFASKLAVLKHNINDVLLCLRYISYAQVERSCEHLATRLVERFGRNDVRQFRFAAIPRGGFVVLGLLAYMLGLAPGQLDPVAHNGEPVVIVDDCALTGARFGRFMRQYYPDSPIVFAHLFSHPELRSAIESREANVHACFTAHDLHEIRPMFQQDDNAVVSRERWFALLGAPRYWSGQTEHLCFPWNEPDRLFWNPVTEAIDSGWHFVPPQLCLKNRLLPGIRTIPVQVQPESPGPYRPSETVIYGEFDAQILVTDLENGKSFSLEGVAASMWRYLVMYGSLDKAADALLREYDAEETRLWTDLKTFVNDLLDRGLLEDAAHLA